jgi:hypothetical protein
MAHRGSQCPCESAARISVVDPNPTKSPSKPKKNDRLDFKRQKRDAHASALNPRPASSFPLQNGACCVVSLPRQDDASSRLVA